MAPRPVEHPDPERVQQRTVRVLVAAQVLGGAAIGVGAAVSPLLAKEILGDDTFAGVAFAALTFGSALAAVPLSRVMSRRGRRPGLVRGYVMATAGAGAAVIAAEIESFPLLLAGMVLMGSGTAANLLARYAVPISPRRNTERGPSPPSCGRPRSAQSRARTRSVPPADSAIGSDCRPWPDRSWWHSCGSL
jgi:MFS family permease